MTATVLQVRHSADLYIATGTPVAASLVMSICDQLEQANSDRDFYKRRVEALQNCQSTMRDPERTMACDIIANGGLLMDGSGKMAANRYAVPMAAPSPSMGTNDLYLAGYAAGKLAAPSTSPTVVRVCPDKDGVCGDNSRYWCNSCPKHTTGAPSTSQPVAWALTAELTKRETTTRAHLWFSDPMNCMWSALFTTPQAAPSTSQPLKNAEILQGCEELGLSSSMGMMEAFELGVKYAERHHQIKGGA